MNNAFVNTIDSAIGTLEKIDRKARKATATAIEYGQKFYSIATSDEAKEIYQTAFETTKRIAVEVTQVLMALIALVVMIVAMLVRELDTWIRSHEGKVEQAIEQVEAAKKWAAEPRESDRILGEVKEMFATVKDRVLG